jgi:ATP-binding cassette subfamily F protein 3
MIFLKLILNKPNFLILDEPTNHLDIQSKEILIEALEDYDGSILAVSHDRNFLDNIVNKLYIIKQNKVDIFNGNYSEYKAYLLENQPVKTSNNKNNDKNKLNTSTETPKKINVEAELKKLAEKEAKLLKEYEVAGKENNLELLIKIQAQLDEIEAKLADLMG